MLTSTASCVQACGDCDVFSFDSSFNSNFDSLVISLGGGIMLTSTASCVQAGCERDVFSSDPSFNSGFDFSYLFRWMHHAHVDC